MSGCSCGVSNPVSKDYIGSTAWELRHRTGYASNGTGVHGGRHTHTFNEGFWNQCDDFAEDYNYYTSTYGSKPVDWFGDIGIVACKANSWHACGRAFDLTAVYFTDGGYVDCNRSWRWGLTHKRRYLGLAAQLRREFGTVLTAWYNTAHKNHIHFDNGSAFTVIRTSYRSDTTLVQASCNYLDSAGLSIDGVWGPRTEAAYQNLLRAFHLQCYDPKTSTWAASVFLEKIVQHCYANKSAGYYVGSCGGPT